MLDAKLRDALLQAGVASGLARMMAVRCISGLSEHDKQLHVVYLANDILVKG
jgi:hypothetical protein